LANWPPEGWKGKLLTGASPLQVLPDLAVAVGLNESLMLQQLHYWTCNSGSDEGWITKTIADLSESFPFLHRDTIKRTAGRLRELELVEVTQLHGRTNSYRLRYDTLEGIAGGQFAPMLGGQNAPPKSAGCTTDEGKLHPSTNKEKRKRKRTTKPGRAASRGGEGPLSRLLADELQRLHPNGKRPTVGKAWADAEDRLQRIDGAPAEQIEFVIRWCMADGFNQDVVRSMPKLRDRYDELVTRAMKEAPSASKPGGGSTAGRSEDRIRALEQMKQRVLAEEAKRKEAP